MISIMCCGCLRLLAKNGGLIGKPNRGRGVISILELSTMFQDIDHSEVAIFESDDVAGADKFAKKYGWSVVDGDHRCPECRRGEQSKEYAVPQRTGAYLPWPLE